MDNPNIKQHPIHLGRGAQATKEPVFTGMDWYAPYAQRHIGDGIEGRLVTMHTMTTPWDVWEMHPKGDEVVLCIEGEITLLQKEKEDIRRTILKPGEYAINPKGVWHTADVSIKAKVLFITAGKDTEHKARDN